MHLVGGAGSQVVQGVRCVHIFLNRPVLAVGAVAQVESGEAVGVPSDGSRVGGHVGGSKAVRRWATAGCSEGGTAAPSTESVAAAVVAYPDVVGRLCCQSGELVTVGCNAGDEVFGNQFFRHGGFGAEIQFEAFVEVVGGHARPCRRGRLASDG